VFNSSPVEQAGPLGRPNVRQVTVGRCYIWYSEEGTGRGRSPPRTDHPRCTKCNSLLINGQCTNHCIAVAYNGPLLCGFNVPIKRLNSPDSSVLQGARGEVCCISYHLLRTNQSHLMVFGSLQRLD